MSTASLNPGEERSNEKKCTCLPKGFPLHVVLGELWKGYGKNEVWAQCALARRVALVSKEWAELVKSWQNGGQSFEHVIARNQYGEFLGGGFGIPRSKILDSLYKEISLETAATRLRRPVVDCNTLNEYTTLVSTAGRIAAMAFAGPETATVSTVACWRGSLGGSEPQSLRHGLLIYCLEQASIVYECHNYGCRINALHASVNGGVFVACQNGSVKLLLPALRHGRSLSHNSWDDVQEKLWVHPAAEALSCMHVREGNASTIAVASKSGVHILQGNESGFRPMYHHAFLRPACSADTAATLNDIKAQLLITSSSRLVYLDAEWMLTWTFDSSGEGLSRYQERDLEFVAPAGADMNVAAAAAAGVGVGGLGGWAGMLAQGGATTAVAAVRLTHKERLVPAGRLRVRQAALSLVTHEDEEVWALPILGARLLDFGGDEALLYVVFDSLFVVASIHDPSQVMLCTRRALSVTDVEDYANLDLFPLHVPHRLLGHPHAPPAPAAAAAAAAAAEAAMLLGEGVGEAFGWEAAEEGVGDPLMMAMHGLSRLAEQPKVALSGNVVLCCELVDASFVTLRLWLGHGASADGWKAVERARCKMAVQRRISIKCPEKRSLHAASPRELPLVEDAALDYLFMLLAVTAHSLETVGDWQFGGGGKGGGGGGVDDIGSGIGIGRRGSGTAGEVDPEITEEPLSQRIEKEKEGRSGEEALAVCIHVARVRRGCGEKEGVKWLRTLQTLGGPVVPLLEGHETGEYWKKAFGVSEKACQEIAQCVAESRKELKLLRIPQVRQLLRRHILYSNRPPALRLLFTDTIEDSLPHCRAELEDLGRCQGRPAALQEWKRRWLATVRALFKDTDYVHQVLLQRLAQFS